MEEIRDLLNLSDTEPLLEVLQLTTMDPEIRNRAASLLFGVRLADAPLELSRVACEVRRFFDASIATDDWRVLRAVALALADQAHDTDPIIQWLNKLRDDPGLAEANLLMSDKYNNGRKNAVNKYLQRLQDRADAEPWGRLWEVFYLGRRAARSDEDVIKELERCLNISRSADLRTLCQESLNLLRTRNSTPPLI